MKIAPTPTANESEPPPERRRNVRHHPVLGFQYIPGTRLILPRPGRGHFELRVNSAGIRSDREYSHAKPPGVFRILAFGDSHAGGFYQSGDRRFSMLVERRNPGIEIINFALGGTGTDQQLLTFEEIGCRYEHDLIMLMPLIENIRRNPCEALLGYDPETGRTVIRPKPFFELDALPDGAERLVLRNIPVPEDQCDAEEVTAARTKVEPSKTWDRRIRSAIDRLAAVRSLKAAFKVAAFPLIGYEQFPEYKDAGSYEWRLMAAIIRRFAEKAGDKPFVIVPLVTSAYMRFPMGRRYWDRFVSLADGKRIHAIDVLPYFLALGRRAPECYLEPADTHPSDLGHAVLADAVESELRRLSLLPGSSVAPPAPSGSDEDPAPREAARGAVADRRPAEPERPPHSLETTGDHIRNPCANENPSSRGNRDASGDDLPSIGHLESDDRFRAAPAFAG